MLRVDERLRRLLWYVALAALFVGLWYAVPHIPKGLP